VLASNALRGYLGGEHRSTLEPWWGAFLDHALVGRFVQPLVPWWGALLDHILAGSIAQPLEPWWGALLDHTLVGSMLDRWNLGGEHCSTIPWWGE